jgi:hypothetical protein
VCGDKRNEQIILSYAQLVPNFGPQIGLMASSLTHLLALINQHNNIYTLSVRRSLFAQPLTVINLPSHSDCDTATVINPVTDLHQPIQRHSHLFTQPFTRYPSTHTQRFHSHSHTQQDERSLAREWWSTATTYYKFESLVSKQLLHLLKTK